ncbi:phage head morphogenesis protein [Macrococcus capreoli]|uniref:phage head morphogenesis protein n=1 Tax=Macrococcus capreoli TaxID=2982690 RepID=UPI003EE6A9A0
MDQQQIRKYINSLINKADKEIDKVWSERLLEILKAFEALYQKALKGGKVSWTEVQRHNLLEKQLERMADELKPHYAAIAALIMTMREKVYVENYLRNVYLFKFGANVTEIEVTVPSTNTINRMLEQPINKIKLEPTLKKHQKEIVSRMRIEMTKSLQSGEGYEKMATRIEKTTNVSRNQAKKVARVEAKRAMELSGLDAAHEANDAGADMEKVWNATLDFKTRDSHQALDGQRVGLDEAFHIDGCKGQAPGLFVGANSARQNINCRCGVLYTVDGELPEIRRAKTEDGSELIEYMTYNEWRASLEK